MQQLLSAISERCKSMRLPRILQFCGVLGGCNALQSPAWRGLPATTRPRPETCLERRREAMQHSQARSSRCLCRLDLSSPARGHENRGPQSEAWHTSVWSGLERLPGQATVLRERMPRLLFSTLSGRDSLAAAQINCSLSCTHSPRRPGRRNHKKPREASEPTDSR